MTRQDLRHDFHQSSVEVQYYSSQFTVNVTHGLFSVS